MSRKQIGERILIACMILPYAAYFGWQKGVLGFLCVLFCLFALCLDQKIILVKCAEFYCIAGLSAMSLISMYLAYDKSLAILGTLQVVGLLLFYLICLRWKYYAGQKMENQATEVIVYCGFIISCVGMILSFNADISSLVVTKGRLSSSMAYPNAFAAFLLVCIILSNNMKKKHWDLFTIQTALWAALLLSFSRINYVLAGVAFVAMLIMNRDRALLITGSTASGVALGTLLSTGKQFIELFPRIESINPNTTEWMERLFYYKDAIPMILDHPFGMGAGNSYLFQGQYQSALYYDVPLLHNGILQMAVDFGIAAPLLFLTAIILCFFRGKQFTNTKLALAALLLHGLVDFDWQFVIMLYLFVAFFTFEENRFEEIRLTKPWRFIIGGALVLLMCVNLWVIGFDLNTYLGNYKAAQKWNPYCTAALLGYSKELDVDQARRLLDRGKEASGYMDESVFLESLNRNKKDNNHEAAWKDAKRLTELRPLKIEYVEEMAALSYLLGQKEYGEGNRDQAVRYLEQSAQVDRYLNAIRKKIDPKAYELKHKPNLVMTDRLTGLKLSAEQLIREIEEEGR